MNTSDVLGALQRFKAKFGKKFGIKALGVFGSFARRQQEEASDVDVVVSLEESDFFTLVAIQEELEKLLGRKVDVVNFTGQLPNNLHEHASRIKFLHPCRGNQKIMIRHDFPAPFHHNP